MVEILDKATMDSLTYYISLNPEGIDRGEFDLCLDVKALGWNSFTLWMSGDVCVDIPLELTKENAILIQETVRKLGRRLFHSWDMQYSEEP